MLVQLRFTRDWNFIVDSNPVFIQSFVQYQQILNLPGSFLGTGDAPGAKGGEVAAFTGLAFCCHVAGSFLHPVLLNIP